MVRSSPLLAEGEPPRYAGLQARTDEAATPTGRLVEPLVPWPQQTRGLKVGAGRTVLTASRSSGSISAEDASRKGEAHVPDACVDELVDSQVAGQTAQDVGVFATQPVLGAEPFDHRSDGLLGTLHQIGVDPHGSDVASLVPRRHRARRSEGRSRERSLVQAKAKGGTHVA